MGNTQNVVVLDNNGLYVPMHLETGLLVLTVKQMDFLCSSWYQKTQPVSSLP